MRVPPGLLTGAIVMERLAVLRTAYRKHPGSSPVVMVNAEPAPALNPQPRLPEATRRIRSCKLISEMTDSTLAAPGPMPPSRRRETRATP